MIAIFDSSVSVYSGILTLYMLFFYQNHKHMFIIFNIAPHWHDTGGWDFPLVRQGLAFFTSADIMASNDLATQGAKLSAPMVLTKLNRDNSAPTLRVKWDEAYSQFLAEMTLEQF